MLTQRDFPFTIGFIGDAWLAAAAFERARLTELSAPTAQSGLSPQLVKESKERTEALIMTYEQRAEAHFKAACLGADALEREEIAA
jgi:hypothetical protein